MFSVHTNDGSLKTSGSTSTSGNNVYYNETDGKYYEVSVQTVSGLPVFYWKESTNVGKYLNNDDGKYYYLIPQIVDGTLVPYFKEVV